MIETKDLVGAWTIEAFKLTDGKGVTIEPWEPGATGYLVYGAEGHMAALITAREKIAGAASRTTTLGYSGPFECKGTHVLHHVTVASQPGIVGTTQRREARLEDGRLILISAPSLVGGPGSKAELFWRRAQK